MILAAIISIIGVIALLFMVTLFWFMDEFDDHEKK